MFKITKEAKRALQSILTNDEVEEAPNTVLPRSIIDQNVALNTASGEKAWYDIEVKELNNIKILLYKDLIVKVIKVRGGVKIDPKYATIPGYRIQVYNHSSPRPIFISTKFESLTTRAFTLKGSGVDWLPQIAEIKVTDDGVLYGLAYYTNAENERGTYFFRFHNFLDEIEQPKSYDDVKETVLFMDAFFDIGTEITKEEFEDKELAIKLGNAAFAFTYGDDEGVPQYSKIAFNRDAYDKDKFAFVVWKDTTKKMTLVQFAISENNIHSIRQVDFIINQDVSVRQGGNLPGADFDGISTMGILTGDSRETGGKTNKGSIVFSTQKDAGENRIVPFNGDQTFVPRNYSNYYEAKSFLDTSRSTIQFETTVLSANKMKEILSVVLGYVRANPTEIDYSMAIRFYNFSDGKTTLADTLDIDKNYIDSMLRRETVEVKIRTTLFFEPRTIRVLVANRKYENQVVVKLTYLQAIIVYGDRRIITSKLRTGYSASFNTTEGLDVSDVYALLRTAGDTRGFFGYNPDIRIQKSHPKLADKWKKIHLASYQSNEPIQVTILVGGKRIEQVVKENSTSQIIINDDPDSSDNQPYTYEIKMSENNSFEGTAPIFINPKRALIPLRTKADDRYNIFDFDILKSVGTSEINRFYNETATANIMTLNLLAPKSITQVLVNNSRHDEFKLNKGSGRIEITGLSDNDLISVQYKSQIRKPTKIDADAGHFNYLMSIATINNKDEIPTSFPTVIGTSWVNSINNNFLHFNLYDGYSKLVDNNDPLLTFKQSMVRGYRQKNIFWIYGIDENNTSASISQQIYAEGDDPYLKLPYLSSTKTLQLSRLNVQQSEIRYSRFDNKFLDITTHDNITIAATTAGKTDLTNTNNNKVVIFGNTNMPLFEIDRNIYKLRNEIKHINFNVETLWLDEKNNAHTGRSNELAKIFNSTKTFDPDLLNFTKYKALTIKDAVFADGDILGDQKTYSEEDGTINIQLQIPPVPPDEIPGTGGINRIQLFNAKGEKVAEDTFRACTKEIYYSKTIKIVIE